MKNTTYMLRDIGVPIVTKYLLYSSYWIYNLMMFFQANQKLISVKFRESELVVRDPNEVLKEMPLRIWQLYCVIDY